MRQWITRTCLAVLIVIVGLPAAFADERVALIIGNSGYRHVSHLPNPVNDAADIAASFERLGFEVRKENDLTYDMMRRVLRDFSRKAARAEFAVIFFAGHGIEVNKHNYLIPVDAELKSDLDIEYEAVPLDLIMNAVDGASKLKLVLLDSCRNNPFASSMQMASGKRSIGRGLARVEPDVGTLVSFAAKEGTTADDGEGRNSPYTAALLRHLEQPGLEINFLFRKVRDSVMTTTNRRQQPFTYGSLPGQEIFLKAAAKVATQATTAGADQIAELRALLERQRAEFEKFKQQTKEARDKVAALPPAAEETPTGAEDQPATTRGTAKEIYESGHQAFTSRNYDEALRHFRSAAAKGHAAATTYLGIMYARGLTVSRNDTEAVKWYRKAADKGEPYAITNLGHMYADGRGVTRDDTEALRLYRKAADMNHADAVNYVGVMYAKGRGVARDDGEAVYWYRKAAQMGELYGMTNLGHMYADGRGVAQNESEALKWYRKAADQGHADAMNYVGIMYAKGRGVPKNEAEAARWYRKAADNGEPYAMTNLAHFYADGRGVARDDVEAFRWFKKAADTGHADAMNYLGNKYAGGIGVARDERQAVHWYRKAAEKGEVYAMTNLGRMYANGQGVAKNESEAVQWYRRAAEKSHPNAMNYLGIMYQNGRGVPRDDAEAFRWYRKAAEKGESYAMGNLGYMYENGRGVAQSYADAVHWYRKATEKENPVGMYNLGVMYQNGRGVARNDREAFRLFRKSAEGNDTDAMYKLGYMYEGGVGVSRNYAEGAKWMARSIKMGNDYSVKEMTTNSTAWNRTFLRELQKILRAEGYYKGAIDGRFGNSTIRAIKRYGGKS